MVEVASEAVVVGRLVPDASHLQIVAAQQNQKNWGRQQLVE